MLCIILEIFCINIFPTTSTNISICWCTYNWFICHFTSRYHYQQCSNSCIFQQSKIIGRKLLSPNWLEALAIGFGLRHFCQKPIGGPPATIITDHKFLVAIFTNNYHISIKTEDHNKLYHQDIFLMSWMEKRESKSF